MTKDQLNKFCARRDSREYLRRPTAEGDFIVASNGYIAIRVAVSPDLADIASCETKHVVFSDVIQKSILPGQAFFPVPTELPPGKICEYCYGSGNSYRCNSCEGKGEFEHEGYDYECKPCDGYGQVRDAQGPDEEEEICCRCDGTGQSKEWQPVAIGDANFEARLIRLIAALPSIKVAPNGPTRTAYFSFVGGDGCIMTTRV